MTKLRELRPVEPKLTLVEAKKILAKAVLKLDDHCTDHHQEYRQSVSNIRHVASQFLKRGDHGLRKRKKSTLQSEEDAKKKRKDEEEESTPKEILVPVQEKPGPCPCTNCRQECHIPGLHMSHQCPHCPKSFHKTSHLRSHMLTHDSVREHVCTECGAKFKRYDQLVRHLYTHDSDNAKERFRCKTCKSTFTRKDNFRTHIKRKQKCREAIGDSDISFGLEVLESGKNSAVVKPVKRKSPEPATVDTNTELDAKPVLQQGNEAMLLPGNEAMLLPVKQNEDGTLTVTGQAINMTLSEAEELLKTKSWETETAQVVDSQTNVYPVYSSDKDAYHQPAPTPPDIVTLNTNIPITDQVVIRPHNVDQGMVVVDSGLGYQTEFTNVDINTVRGDVQFEIQDLNTHTVCGVDTVSHTNHLENELTDTISNQVDGNTPNKCGITENVVNDIEQSIQGMPPNARVDNGSDGLSQQIVFNGIDFDSSNELKEMIVGQLGVYIRPAEELVTSDMVEQIPTPPASTPPASTPPASTPPTEEVPDQPTDLLSRVIADILGDTGTEGQDEVDDQIINVMQGGHTITSTPPRTKCAMELLDAVMFLSARVSQPPGLQDRAVSQPPGLQDMAVSDHLVCGGGEEIAGGVPVQHGDAGSEPSTHPPQIVPSPTSSHITPTKSNTPSKTPRSRQPKSRAKRSPKTPASPINKVVKIVNSRRSGESSFVKHIFRAKKRLFTEKGGDEDESPEVLKLGISPLMGLDVLKQNDKLRAQVLSSCLREGTTDIAPKNNTTNLTVKQEVEEVCNSTPSLAVKSPETEAERQDFSPFRESLLAECPVNCDTLLSPISPLRVHSPLLQDQSPNFFLLSSPFRSKTPDQQLDKSSPLFLRSQTPENVFLRSSTPERSILQTPDQSRLGVVSFGSEPEEQPAFEDNFIWRELEHMFKSKVSSPVNSENYWFQS